MHAGFTLQKCLLYIIRLYEEHSNYIYYNAWAKRGIYLAHLDFINYSVLKIAKSQYHFGRITTIFYILTLLVCIISPDDHVYVNAIFLSVRRWFYNREEIIHIFNYNKYSNIVQYIKKTCYYIAPRIICFGDCRWLPVLLRLINIPYMKKNNIFANCIENHMIWHNSVRVRVIAYNSTVNNISVISWWSVLLTEEHLDMCGIRTHNCIGDMHLLHM